MIGHLLTEMVTILNRQTGDGDDDWGRPPETWPEPGTDIPGRLELAAPDEGTDEQDVQFGRRRLFLPAGTTISGRDRVRVDGILYEVVGPPIIHRTPRGPHHIEAVCSAVQ